MSALNINLDITEISFHLDAQDKYILEIQLPFPVDKNNGVAKFDAQKRVLSVTLPVIACQDVPLPISEFDSLKLESPEEAPSPSLVQELNPFHKASPESGLEENGDNSSELNGALIEKVAAAAEPHHAVEATEPISLPELAKKELTQTASPNNVQDLNESIQNISLNPPLKDSKNFLPNAELRPLAPLTFQSSQDDKTITIIIDNRKIKKDTALINIQNQCAELHLSDDEFSYCLDLDFTIALQPEYRIDVSSKNTVVVFYKVVPALITRIIVNNGAAGPTDHYFLTMDNVNEFLGPDRKVNIAYVGNRC